MMNDRVIPSDMRRRLRNFFLSLPRPPHPSQGVLFASVMFVSGPGHLRAHVEYPRLGAPCLGWQRRLTDLGPSRRRRPRFVAASPSRAAWQVFQYVGKVGDSGKSPVPVSALALDMHLVLSKSPPHAPHKHGLATRHRAWGAHAVTQPVTFRKVRTPTAKARSRSLGDRRGSPCGANRWSTSTTPVQGAWLDTFGHCCGPCLRCHPHCKAGRPLAPSGER